MYRGTYRMPVRPGDRFIGGGFLGPFVLGGITGGLLAPAFYPRPFFPGPRPFFPGPGPFFPGPGPIIY